MSFGFPFVPLTAPSQLPVPSGLIPACHPSGGARVAIWSSVGETEVLVEVMPVGTAVLVTEVLVGTPQPAGVVDAAVDIAEKTLEDMVVDEATVDIGGGVALEDPLVEVSAPIAFPCAEKVVEEIGQPTPGPSRFCRVTAAAFKRASWDAVLLSVGKESFTVGFVVTKPAATFLLRLARKNVEFGGHWQGTRIGFPLVPFTAPSQFPVPSGLTPDCQPKDGTSAGLTSRLL